MQKKNEKAILLESLSKANSKIYMSDEISSLFGDANENNSLIAFIDSQELKVLSYSKTSLKTNISLLIDEKTATGIILENMKVLSILDLKIDLNKVLKYKVVKKKDNYILKIKFKSEDLK